MIGYLAHLTLGCLVLAPAEFFTVSTLLSSIVELPLSGTEVHLRTQMEGKELSRVRGRALCFYSGELKRGSINCLVSISHAVGRIAATGKVGLLVFFLSAKFSE